MAVFWVCLCLTIHIATALHLFSACTLDVTSTVMTRMHVRSSMRARSPLSGSSVNESCAQDTEQKHGKQGDIGFCFSSLLCGRHSAKSRSPGRFTNAHKFSTVTVEDNSALQYGRSLVNTTTKLQTRIIRVTSKVCLCLSFGS